MHDFLKEIWLSDKAGEAGVCLIPCIRVTLEDGNIWEDIVYGCQHLNQKQLDSLNEGRARKFTRGHFFTTFTSEPLKFIPFLTKTFLENGGKFVKRRIQNLNEFSHSSEFDIIVNCTGLGSKTIVGDTKMHAIRGQVARVKANWLYCAFIDEADDGNYIIPNTESVVLGGTHQIDDFNTSIYPEDSEFIFKGCKELLPGLKHVPTLFQWAGLRPGRNDVRLEPEILSNGKIIIHNYGHGGCGVTVAWGCAEDVVKIVQTQFSKL
ncbi:DDO family protein [Megaselia abdita]